MKSLIEHISIFEGMKAIGAGQASLISKSNLTADLVLNVRSNF
jgi:hypothetical protein